jgi:hypothetical protein
MRVVVAAFFQNLSARMEDGLATTTTTTIKADQSTSH